MGHLDGHTQLRLDQPTGWAGGASSVPTPSGALRLRALIRGVAPDLSSSGDQQQAAGLGGGARALQS